MKVKPKIFLLLFLILIYKSSSQGIEIGNKADYVLDLVKWSTNDSKSVWDVKYYDGKISEVIQCHEDRYLIDFRVMASFCRHYIMDHDTLAYILAQYKNVSTEKLKSIYDNLSDRHRIGEYYFTENFMHYSEIYKAENGLASASYTKTLIENLPDNMRSLVSSKIKEQESAQALKYLTEEREKKRIDSIKSIVYDISIYDPTLYKEQQFEVKKEILFYLRSIGQHVQNSFYQFGPNVYDLEYTLNELTSSSATGFNHNLISGSDSSCTLFNNVFVTMPSTKIDGIKVRTLASFKSFKVCYFKGNVTVKSNKKGRVKYLKGIPDFNNLQDKILKELQNVESGKHSISYETGILGDEPFTFIYVDP